VPDLPQSSNRNNGSSARPAPIQTLMIFGITSQGRANDLRPGLRSFPVLQYVIIYRIEDEDVVILHVFHGRRDIESLFQQ
jgi:hypothetical protein